MIKVKSLKNLRHKRYKVVIDDQGKEQSYQVSEDLIVEYRLVNDKVLDQALYLDFVKASMRDAIYQKVLHFALYKMRSSQEIHDYLERKTIPQSQHAYYLDKLKKAGILNDRLFTETYIKEQFQFKHSGPLKIARDLQQKGIPKVMYQPYLDQIGDDDIEAQMQLLFDKKLGSMKPMSMINAKRSLLTYLLGRGFDMEQSKRFIERHHDQLKIASQASKGLDRDFTLALKKYRHTEQKRQKIIAFLMRKGYPYAEIKKKVEASDDE